MLLKVSPHSENINKQYENKMAYTAKDPPPPWHFLYLRETKSLRWDKGEEGEEGEGKKVSLLTHATAMGMGKNCVNQVWYNTEPPRYYYIVESAESAKLFYQKPRIFTTPSKSL